MLAYHDRSDGGLLVTLLEMAFAAHCGLRIDLGMVDDLDRRSLCRGARGGHRRSRQRASPRRAVILARHGLADLTRDVGEPAQGSEVQVRANRGQVYGGSRIALHRRWSEVSYRMQALRDNPDCAREEYARLRMRMIRDCMPRLSYDPREDVAAPFIQRGARPAVAVLREQGVNSQMEMAAVFTRCGFDAYDVHMTDILAGRVRLAQISWAGGVRRLFLRRCAGRRRRLGEVHSVQRPRRAKSLRRSSGAMRPSPWACATAVKCCPP